MAELILPDYYRAQAVLQGQSGLAEDRYINTFVFRNTGGLGVNRDNVADAILSVLGTFYDTVATPAANTIASFFSNLLVKPTMEIRVYDLGQQTPRMPYIRTRTLGTIGAATALLPEEVTACLTFYAGRSTPRTRGRVYIGPLAASSLGATSGRTFIQTGLRDAVRHSAARMATQTTSPVEWAILSQRDGQARKVTGGWVDDAFDIQRRRGPAPAARSTWGAAQTS